VALLATSSLLDGIFGQGELRHAARWQAVKTILRLEEEDEKGVTTIREKEQFSHCLNLLYADGRTAVLTNDPPPGDEDDASNEAPLTQAGAETATVGSSDPRRPSRKFRIEEE